MTDNIIEFEGAAYAFSQLYGVTLAGILLDFSQAFPSLAHAWMWAVISSLGVCDEMQNLPHALYDSLVTTVLYNNTELNEFAIAAGVKQGCPLSGTLFAIAVDPLVRAHIAHITLRSSTISLFVDDVAVVLRCLAQQLGPLLQQMASWRRASGLGLKVNKCVILMLNGDAARYEQILAEHPGADGMRLARAAKYLGTEVGPDGYIDQWRSVSKKMAARVPDIASSPSLTGRVVLFTSYVSSLYSFKTQFSDAPSHITHEYGRAVQNITKAPWQGFPTALLTRRKGLRYPVEIRELSLVTFEAQARTIQRSQVWERTLALIDEVATSDDARLDPRCPWHATPIIETLRRTQRRIFGMPPEIQLAITDGDNRKLHELLQRQGVGREGVIRGILLRRSRRWSETPAVLVDAVVKFSQSTPPTEFITSALRGLLYTWCTSARFAHPMRDCNFSGMSAADRQQHYLACAATRRWISDRFGIV